MRNHPFVRTAGLLCLVGALIGAVGGLVTAFYPPAVGQEQFSYPYEPAAFLIAESSFVINHVLLLIGLVGLARSGVTGSSRLGGVGNAIAIAGMALLTACEVWAMTFARSAYPTSQTDLLDTGYGIATMAIGVGLTLAGVAVLRARLWSGWQRLITLLTGVAVFVIVLPGVFGPALVGRLVLTIWMLMFAALGWAMYRTPVGRTA